jgi:hypothetical protein
MGAPWAQDGPLNSFYAEPCRDALVGQLNFTGSPGLVEPGFQRPV